MFATKAVRVWQDTPEADRPALVGAYLRVAGGFGRPKVEAFGQRQQGGGGDPLWAVIARRDHSTSR